MKSRPGEISPRQSERSLHLKGVLDCLALAGPRMVEVAAAALDAI